MLLFRKCFSSLCRRFFESFRDFFPTGHCCCGTLWTLASGILACNCTKSLTALEVLKFLCSQHALLVALRIREGEDGAHHRE
jgi:hypothetical protein